jgi:hypothetical protein
MRFLPECDDEDAGSNSTMAVRAAFPSRRGRTRAPYCRSHCLNKVSMEEPRFRITMKKAPLPLWMLALLLAAVNGIVGVNVRARQIMAPRVVMLPACT